ncbi:MAG: SDR family NAD(P)-dependent oxidoreductase [Solirubrobacterales bacterium]
MSHVVVITGASSGIGRATARRFARPGVSLALIARGRDGLQEAVREAEQAGARALALPADVSTPTPSRRPRPPPSRRWARSTSGSTWR